MIRGARVDQERAVARAVELGINYFDTAPLYGDGQSERHLGQVFNTLKPEARVGTKVRLAKSDMGNIRDAVLRSLEASLKRLALERVDLVQLHNQIALERCADAGILSAQDVLEEVAPAFQTLQQQGKTRWYGFTGMGETAALQQVIDAGVFDTVQVVHSLLNPSAGYATPEGFPAQDFGRLLDRARQQEMGSLGIRVLAAGALGGEERHPIAVPTVAPMGSGPDYATDLRRARSFDVLIREGYARNLVEAALRFALTTAGMSIVLLGCSSLEQIEVAADHVSKGPLPRQAIEHLMHIWRCLADS